MNLTTDYTTNYNRALVEKIIDQDKKCIKYIHTIQYSCFIPEKLKKSPIQKLISVLQRNYNFLDAYYYRLDEYIFDRGIINEHFNKEVKMLLNREMNKISLYLDSIQYLTAFI